MSGMLVRSVAALAALLVAGALAAPGAAAAPQSAPLGVAINVGAGGAARPR